jgi:hypothetical protein
MTPSVEFPTTHSESLIEQASIVVSRKTVRRLLTRTLRIAIAINCVAFCAVAVFFGNSSVTWMMGVLALVVPLYWPWLLLSLPRKIRKRMAQGAAYGKTVEVSGTGFCVANEGRSFRLLWADLQSIEEYEGFFLFTLKESGTSVVIPSLNMPPVARAIVAEASSAMAARVS